MSRNITGCDNRLRKSPYSVRLQENSDQKTPCLGNFQAVFSVFNVHLCTKLAY